MMSCSTRGCACSACCRSRCSPCSSGGSSAPAGSRRVVDAAERQRRPQVVALGGVVVDHVEDDLDAGRVQRLDHRLELGHLLAAVARNSDGPGRRSRSSCSPSSCSAPCRPNLSSTKVCTGSSSTAVTPSCLSARWPAARRAPRRCRAASSGTSGCSLGEALDVHLVDDRLVPRHVRRPIVAPVERGDRRRRTSA